MKAPAKFRGDCLSCKKGETPPLSPRAAMVIVESDLGSSTNMWAADKWVYFLDDQESQISKMVTHVIEMSATCLCGCSLFETDAEGRVWTPAKDEQRSEEA